MASKSNAFTSVEKKIQLLLNKAEGTDNEHERDAFMAQAERMMIQNGIDRAKVNRDRQAEHNRENIVMVFTGEFKGIYADAQISMISEIFFGTLPVQLFKSDKKLCIVGYEGDVSFVNMMITSMTLQCATSLKAYTREIASRKDLSSFERFKERREFVLAFGRAAGKKMRETYGKTVTESESSNPGTEVALVNRGKEVANWIDANMQIGRGVRSRIHAGTGDGKAAGTEAGSKANTGGVSVGSGRKAIAG